MAAIRIESILLLDGIDKVCGETLAAANIAVTIKGKLTKDELLKEIKVRIGAGSQISFVCHYFNILWEKEVTLHIYT